MGIALWALYRLVGLVLVGRKYYAVSALFVKGRPRHLLQ